MRAAIDTRWKICAGAPATALILFAGCSSGVSAVNQTAPPVVTPAATVIYLVDKANNDIDQFSTTEDGSASATGTLTLPATRLAYSVATDSSGDIYVGCQSQVFVFAANSTGAATPLRVLNVPSSPFELSVDSAGLLYVGMGSDTVNIYSATASNDEAPLRSLRITNFQVIGDVATDASGNVYVAGSTSGTGFIDIFSSTQTGSAVPVRMITGSNIFGGVAVDASNNLFATTNRQGNVVLEEFSASASGAASPLNTVILGGSISLTYFVGNVRRDAAGNIYTMTQVSAGSKGPNTTSIFAFSPVFSSNSTPLSTVSTTSVTSQSLQLAVH